MPPNTLSSWPMTEATPEPRATSECYWSSGATWPVPRAAYRRADERGHPVGAYNLGALLEQQGDLSGAMDAYRRADERGDSMGAYSLGVLLERDGDLSGAKAAYRRADAARRSGRRLQPRPAPQAGRRPRRGAARPPTSRPTWLCGDQARSPVRRCSSSARSNTPSDTLTIRERRRQSANQIPRLDRRQGGATTPGRPRLTRVSRRGGGTPAASSAPVRTVGDHRRTRPGVREELDRRWRRSNATAATVLTPPPRRPARWP